MAGHLLQAPNVGDLMPVSLFNWGALLTLRGWILMVAGGFLVGSGFTVVIVTLLSAIAGTYTYGLLQEKLPY